MPEDRDHLTGLFKRPAFDAERDRLAGQATADQPASLIIADIDKFKDVNDRHGHQTGDAVLRGVARRIVAVVHGKGEAYRWGGEEIAVLLANHTSSEAFAVAKRARRAIEASDFDGLSITCSFGVATVPEHTAEPTDWFEKADRALYKAKHSGRNLVRLSEELSSHSDARPQRRVRRSPTISWRALSSAVRDKRILGRLTTEKPDLVIAINDGLVPVSMLARNTDFAICYWTVTLDDDCQVDTRGSEPDITGKKVVLLDDQMFTGKRMQAAFKRASQLEGAASANIFRMAVFAHDTPILEKPLDWGPARKLPGPIKSMPWSYTRSHGVRYRPRDRRKSSRNLPNNV